LLNIAAGLPFHVDLATVQELSFARLAHAATNGNGNAMAAAAGNGHGNSAGAGAQATQQTSEAAHQEWSRELSAVREKLCIQETQ
jgi:hypothetical protein